eukprot:2435868-Pleurochrysis_carterae.AAC.1
MRLRCLVCERAAIRACLLSPACAGAAEHQERDGWHNPCAFAVVATFVAATFIPALHPAACRSSSEASDQPGGKRWRRSWHEAGASG